MLYAATVATHQLERLDTDPGERLDEWLVILRSLSQVIEASGIIGWSETSRGAPQGIRLAKLAAKIAALSMSTVRLRVAAQAP